MATIDDFGDTAEALNNPVLGGPAGWAAAVRDYLKNTLVHKDGDTMTGPLSVLAPTDGAHAASKWYVDSLGGFYYLESKTARVIGQAGIYNECGITVAPGTWLVQCGVAIHRADVVGAWCAIGNPGLIANTAGERVVGGGAGYWTVRSALTVITASANMNLFPYLWTEGGSDISIPGTGSGPAGWISATRLRN